VSLTILLRELRTLFDTACTRANITKDRRHYIGLTFTPPDPLRLYAAEDLTAGAEYYAATNVRESIGIYDVLLYAPLNDGTRELTDAADAVRNVFKVGSVETHGVQIAIDAVSVLSFSQDTRSVLLPVSIAYRTWRVVS
jgi:hypothetical protein